MNTSMIYFLLKDIPACGYTLCRMHDDQDWYGGNTKAWHMEEPSRIDDIVGFAPLTYK